MAKVDIKMPDDFLEKHAHLASDEDGMAERVLNAEPKLSKHGSAPISQVLSAEAQRSSPALQVSFYRLWALPE